MAETRDTHERIQNDRSREEQDIARLQEIIDNLEEEHDELSQTEVDIEIERALWRTLQETTPVRRECSSV